MDDEYASRFLADGQAAGYDDLYRPGRRDATIWEMQQRVLRSCIQELLAERSDPRVLDFACGTGRVLAEVHRLVPTVEGTDVSPAMVARAKQRVPGATISVGDITDEALLQYDAYDMVTAFRFVLNAAPETRRVVLSRLRALLLPRNGWLVVNNHGNIASLRHLALRARVRGTGMENELSDRSMRTLLAESGFTVTAVHGFGIFPEVAYRSRFATVARQIDRATAARRWVRPVTIDRLYVARAV